MELHEKSLELNITHELLNLADSWYWFLTDIPLWRYWRPRHRLPFLKCPKSTSGGFHITTEGKKDPTGDAGGGYDVRIKTGLGGHLLFIQYKKGSLKVTSPDPKSEFSKSPFDHYKFEINGTTTNQHFVLRDLANGIGSRKGNAVVYAFPLISDMAELEANAGKLIRKTKFISIVDIDKQALANGVSFTKDQQHNFRVGKFDMNRCEVNFFFFYFSGEDRSAEIITDIIATKFQKTLLYFIKEIRQNYEDYELYEGYIPQGLQQAFIQYVRYLLHYFEVSPSQLQNIDFINRYSEYFYLDEFEKYENSEHDIKILTAIFHELAYFEDFINSTIVNHSKLLDDQLPQYEPKFLIPLDIENGFNFEFDPQTSEEIIENINYLII